ncbi:MAG TPA: cyclase family protein [Candidatus Limnocylindrales bacterium]
MRRLVVLSWPLRADAPVWPGNPPAAGTEAFEAIERGDAANTTVLHLFSHSGTHVDTPWHFNPDGLAAWQLPIETFTFDRPRLIDVPAGERRAIGRADLEPHAEIAAVADLLFIRTGWSANRDTDPRRYAEVGPMLAPDGAAWLVERPRLRAIATDAISIGAPWDIPASIETHHLLMGVGRSDGRFLLIYEDVRMVAEAARATRVHAWPLFVEGADGSPVTIVAELDGPG